MFKGSTQVPTAFSEGKAKKQGANVSTGNALFYQGNKIAEWKDGKLFISNGGYFPENGATGSKTTKDKLNALPSVRISQTQFKWYLNGKEWDGSWIQIKGAKAPKIDTTKAGDVFDTSTKYIHSDGWRGYSEPQYAVCGANDTGTQSDSPCNSNVCKGELDAVTELLQKNGIGVKLVTCQSSNVFCVHHYLVPKVKDFDRAKVLVGEHIATVETRLLYATNQNLVTCF